MNPIWTKVIVDAVRSRSRNLFQSWFNEKEKGRKQISDLTSYPNHVSGCGGGI